ncbi:MAG TPA: shikimate kinase, partial [Burkholderiales bacterium]|nr:shikimate kinase [Burkholderiales bacterium]
ELLAENSTVVWLYASAETCLRRIDSRTRPLLAGEDPEAAAHGLMAARLPYYAAISDLVVRSEEPAETVAATIHEEIGPSIKH